MAHQQTNLLIVSDFDRILQIDISNELFFFFFYQLFFVLLFSFIHYFHFYRQYGDWKKNIFCKVLNIQK